MDNEIYIAKSERQLNDTSSYKKLENDPKQKSSELVSDTIEWFKNDILITKNIAKKKDYNQPKNAKVLCDTKNS